MRKPCRRAYFKHRLSAQRRMELMKREEQLLRRERLAEKRIREATVARTGFTVLILVWCVVLLIMNSFGEALKWAQSPSVKYSAEDAPIETADMERAIENAVWSWNSRIPELGLRYVGLTAGPVSNRSSQSSLKTKPVRVWLLSGCGNQLALWRLFFVHRSGEHLVVI